MDTGATFSGSVADGLLSGTWANEAFGESGTFSGSQTSAADAVLDADVMAQVAGTYTGTATLGGEVDTFTLTIGADGHVSIEFVAAAVTSTSSGQATFAGIDGDGTQIAGTATTAGALSGTLRNDHDGTSGTFEGTKL